jgi:hypothetical protein
LSLVPVNGHARPVADPWQDVNRLQINAGIRFIGPVSAEPAGAVQLGRPLWYSPRLNNAFQAAVRVQGTLAVAESGAVHLFADASFAAELFLGPSLSMEFFRIGLMVGASAMPDGPSASIGMALGGGWALRPFRDGRIAIRLGLSAFMHVATTRDAQPDNDCPLCPDMLVTLGLDVPLDAF